MRVEASRAGRTPRARFGCGVAILTTVIVAAAGTIAALIFFLLSGRSTQVAASFLHAQPGAVRWNENERLTILLMGRESDASRARASSLVVASYNPPTRKLTLLALPTNLWVSIPGFGPGAIGDALADGGVHEAVLTVESVLRVSIPYYAVVGPHALSQIVDALGGISVQSPAAIVLHGIHFSAGSQHLNGPRTVLYGQPGAGDPQSALAATQRELAILLGLEHQSFTSQNFFRIPNVVNAFGGSVTTNFPYDQILDLARKISAVPAGNQSGESVSYLNNTAVGYDSQSTQVLLPDWQAIRSLAQQSMPSTALRALGRVTLVNGTGTSGQALTLRSWLQGDNVRVGAVEAGPANGYAQTEVMVPRSAPPAATSLAETVATLLQVPLASTRGAGSGVVVRMGQDYQDPTQQ